MSHRTESLPCGICGAAVVRQPGLILCDRCTPKPETRQQRKIATLGDLMTIRDGWDAKTDMLRCDDCGGRQPLCARCCDRMAVRRRGEQRLDAKIREELP